MTKTIEEDNKRIGSVTRKSKTKKKDTQKNAKKKERLEKKPRQSNMSKKNKITEKKEKKTRN